MAEITYLLGAGASANSLPVVSDMAKQLGETISWIGWKYKDHSILNRFNTKDQEKFNQIIDDLKWLQGECDTKKNFSIDTYAKKLLLSGRKSEYIKLKNILSVYFTIEQRRNPPDIRYDNFWASILKSKLKLPNNIKIVSWNYDFQLELTYQDFLGSVSLKQVNEALNVFTLETNYFTTSPNDFGIYKLNGSAILSSKPGSETMYWIDNFKDSVIDRFIIEVVELYEKLERINFYNHLSFAWEHNINNNFYSNLREAVSNTEVLVVIGYSFPFFNREIDKLIFNEFMQKDKLRKVYFQAPPEDAEDIRERFLAINDQIDPDKLVLRKDIKQFTLPNEL